MLLKEEMWSGIEASIISPPQTWKASGHISNFTDVSVICTKCKKFNKIDRAEFDKAVCSFCGGKLDKVDSKGFEFNVQDKCRAC